MAGSGARPGPRGLDAGAIVMAAVAVQEEGGDSGFSVRKVAARVGCDPMAVLYHVKSRDGLERAMADHLNAQLRALDDGAPWRERLADLAHQYRELALRFPRTFPLLQRFWVTGPADFRHAEAVGRALADAGHTGSDIVDFCFGFYASVLGLAAAEAGGLLRPATARTLEEVRRLPAEQFPLITSLIPEYATQEPGRVFTLMLDVILDGIAPAPLRPSSEQQQQRAG